MYFIAPTNLALLFKENERVSLQANSIFFTDKPKLPEYHQQDSLNIETSVKTDTGLATLPQLL